MKNCERNSVLDILHHAGIIRHMSLKWVAIPKYPAEGIQLRHEPMCRGQAPRTLVVTCSSLSCDLDLRSSEAEMGGVPIGTTGTK